MVDFLLHVLLIRFVQNKTLEAKSDELLAEFQYLFSCQSAPVLLSQPPCLDP
jgi:hypothetical protein